MKTNSFLFICSAMILWSGQALAAKWPLQVSKGDTVVVKVPLQYWHPEESSFSQPTTPIFSVDTAALAKLNWQTVGLPYFGEFVVTKVTPIYKAFGGKKYIAIELRNNSTWVKLQFQPDSDLASGFASFTFTGTWSKFEATDYFKNVVFGTVGSTIFTGPLAKIPDSTKLALLKIAGTGLATVSSEIYRDKVYVGFAFHLSGTVYNSIKLNEGARAATIINSRLAMLKSLAIIAGDAGVDGVKIGEKILYRDFVSETAVKTDNLQLYAPLQAIKQFSAADITNQQFVDQCIVVVNDNRVQVLLSSGS
jgi:hypothetical protein